MSKTFLTAFALLSIITSCIVPVYGGWNPSQDETARDQAKGNTIVAEIIARFKNNYPNINVFFEKAHGYAVFPTVTKGGMGIGAAHGKGEVYEKETLIGTASLTQVTLGAQLGGQTYSEIVFFKDKETLEDFKSGNFKLGAQASAVAATSGVSTDADYNEGVAVFTLSKKGLMYEASLGGQKFHFKAK